MLLSKFLQLWPSTCIYFELSRSKTDNLCLHISGFVVVLSFGDSEGVFKTRNGETANGEITKWRNGTKDKGQSYKI